MPWVAEKELEDEKNGLLKSNSSQTDKKTCKKGSVQKSKRIKISFSASIKSKNNKTISTIPEVTLCLK